MPLLLVLPGRVPEVKATPRRTTSTPPLVWRREPMEEVINDPTNPQHYWRYRMHVRLDTLLSDEAFIGDLQEILFGSARIGMEDVRDYWEEQAMGDRPGGRRRTSWPGTGAVGLAGAHSSKVVSLGHGTLGAHMDGLTGGFGLGVPAEEPTGELGGLGRQH